MINHENNPIPTLLVGVGGYGGNYVDFFLGSEGKGFLDSQQNKDFTLVGAVDPYAQSAKSYPRLKNTIPIYNTIKDFFAEHKAQLVIISTPVHLHFEHCMAAFENGAHVLCEKPLVPTLKDLDALEAMFKGGNEQKLLAVGFQLCYSKIMLALKERILAGEFGRPKRLKTYISWPRAWEYYNRGVKWAGKIKTHDGHTVYDSVASNATAHFIQNMLFLLGPSMEECAPLTNVQAECYRANKIESFDTIAFKGRAGDADINFYASHATNYEIHPTMDYKFEKARVTINLASQGFECIVHHQDGTIEKQGPCWGGGRENTLLSMAKRIRGQEAHLCTTSTVRPITALINEVFEKVPFNTFPDHLITHDQQGQRTYVKNLHMDLLDCFNENTLPSEAMLPWAMPATATS